MRSLLLLVMYLFISEPILAQSYFIETCEAHENLGLPKDTKNKQISWLKILFKTSNCSKIATKISNAKSINEIIPTYGRYSGSVSPRIFIPLELIEPTLNYENFKQEWDIHVGAFSNLEIFKEFKNLKHIFYEQDPNEGRTICETLAQVPSIESITLRAWELKDEEIKCINEKETKIFLIGNMSPNETTNKLKKQIHGISNFLGNIETIYEYRRLQYLGLEDYSGKASMKVLTVLSNLTHLHINLKNPINIEDLSSLKSILYLSINCFEIKSEAPANVGDRKCKNNAIKELNFLENLTWLKGLDLSWNEIEDISPLSSLHQLQFLNLKENKISNLQPLIDLKSLKYLNLASNNLSNIENVEKLKSLVLLNLSNNHISKINNLSKLHRLKHLSLGNNPIKQISKLKAPQTLETLNLDSNSPAKFNLDPTSLVKIILRKNKNFEERLWVEDILFEDLVKLYTNNIPSFPLPELESMDFTRLKNLEVLSISGNELEDIPDLHKLKKLRYLDASKNRLADNVIFEKVPGTLEYLSLRHNLLTEINSEVNLKQLRMLDLTHNPFKIDYKSHFPSLEVLMLDNCETCKSAGLKFQLP